MVKLKDKVKLQECGIGVDERSVIRSELYLNDYGIVRDRDRGMYQSYT